MEDEGYAAKTQALDFRHDSNFILEMQRALTSTDRLPLVLSVNYMESEFGETEWAGFLPKM